MHEFATTAMRGLRVREANARIPYNQFWVDLGGADRNERKLIARLELRRW